MDSEQKYTGVMVLPKFLYVATEDFAEAKRIRADMTVIEDWRLREGCSYATAFRRRIPRKAVNGPR